MATRLFVTAAMIAVIAVMAAAGASSAHAAMMLSVTDNGLVAPDALVSFEGSALVPDDIIADEFASAGVSFTGGLVFAPCADWPNSAGGWSPAGYGATIGPGCTRNTANNDFSILFANPVDAASLTLHSDTLNGGSLLIEMLSAGGVLDSLTLDDSNDSWCCAPKYLRLDGAPFDAIRVTESDPVSQSWIAIDNLAFNFAAVLPLPGTLALFGAGLLGVGLAARRQTRSAPPGIDRLARRPRRG